MTLIALSARVRSADQRHHVYEALDVAPQRTPASAGRSGVTPDFAAAPFGT
jgi:hypothetical protein